MQPQCAEINVYCGYFLDHCGERPSKNVILQNMSTEKNLRTILTLIYRVPKSHLTRFLYLIVIQYNTY